MEKKGPPTKERVLEHLKKLRDDPRFAHKREKLEEAIKSMSDDRT